MSYTPPSPEELERLAAICRKDKTYLTLNRHALRGYVRKCLDGDKPKQILPMPELKSYQKVAQRYCNILWGKGVEPIEDPSNPFENHHLYWMLNQIRYDALSSETKAHRWLGYVQGVLCYKGVINVGDERDATRNLFNGE